MADQEEDQGIAAYHVSPHEFDRFDLSKIGTGEGAQSYGHGLYFAENPEVSGQGGKYWQSFAGQMEKGPEYTAAMAMNDHKFDKDKAIRDLESAHQHFADRATPGKYGETLENEEIYRQLAEDRKAAAELLKSGSVAGPRTYEVSINAHPDHFLDWDKPAKEQHPHVLNAIAPLFPDGIPEKKKYNETFYGGDLYDLMKQRLGGIMYKKLADEAGIPERLSGGTDERLSKYLSLRGVHGIKYLDAGSRGQGDGTRNYVVFDDKLVNVKRRYALGGAVPHNELDPAKEYKKQTGKVHPDLKIEQPIEGTKERMSNMRADVPVRWASSPDHPSAHLAYITDEEAELLKRADLHDSNIANEHHVGPGGVPSYQGGGIGGGGTSYSGGGANPGDIAGGGFGSGNVGGGSSTGGGGGGSSIGIGGGGGGGGGGSSIGGGGGGGSSMPGIGLGSIDAFGAPGSMKTFGSSDPGQEADKSMVDALSAGMKPGGDIGSSFVKEAISPDLSGGNSPLASGISQYDRSALDAQMDRMRAGQQAERDESYERSVIGPVTKQINVPNAGDLYGATNAPLALQPPSGMFGEPTMGTTTFGTGARSVGFPSQQTGPMDPSQVGYAEQMAKSARQAWLDANTEPESPRLGDLPMPTPNRPFTTPNRAGSVGSMPIGTTPRMADLTPLSSQPARPVTPTPFSTFPQDVQKQMIPVRSDASYGQTLIDPSGEYTQEALKNWNLAQDAVTMLNSPTLAGSIMRGVASITKGITPATPEEQADINRLYQRTYGGGQTSSGQSVRQNFDQAFAAARASGAETFSWTNPATGQKGIYTTQLGRKAGGRVPSLKEPEQWIAQTSKPAAIRKTAKPRTSSKVDGTAIVRRAVMLSSRKS